MDTQFQLTNKITPKLLNKSGHVLLFNQESRITPTGLQFPKFHPTKLTSTLNTIKQRRLPLLEQGCQVIYVLFGPVCIDHLPKWLKYLHVHLALEGSGLIVVRVFSLVEHRSLPFYAGRVFVGELVHPTLESFLNNGLD